MFVRHFKKMGVRKGSNVRVLLCCKGFTQAYLLAGFQWAGQNWKRAA